MADSTLSCLVCGKRYKVCLSCETKKSYRRDVCCKEHSDMHNVVMSYLQGSLTKQEAKRELLKLNVGDINAYREDFTVELKKIFAEPVKKNPVESATIVNKYKK